MEFFRRAAGKPRRLGVFPGTFNPPTRAHVALARSALARVDEVVFVLPREFPHKKYEGASFEDRIRMLDAALEPEPHFSIAASRNGLFIDIARECRDAYGPDTDLYFLCGRDAAERIVNWDYGRPGAIKEQLSEYQLLVAPRQGGYDPPAELRERVHLLPVQSGYGQVSASEVRSRIRRGEAWEQLVPDRIAGIVREIYAA
jgi:nicotinate-nucleotide adenylyltransferase